MLAQQKTCLLTAGFSTADLELHNFWASLTGLLVFCIHSSRVSMFAETIYSDTPRMAGNFAGCEFLWFLRTDIIPWKYIPQKINQDGIDNVIVIQIGTSVNDGSLQSGMKVSCDLVVMVVVHLLKKKLAAVLEIRFSVRTILNFVFDM